MIQDLTKSLIGFSWGMTLFGAHQATNLFMLQNPSQSMHSTAAAFDAVTQAAEEQLSDILKGAFKAGDQLQRGAVDMASGFITLDALNPSQLLQMASQLMQQSTGMLSPGMWMGGSRAGMGSSQPTTGWGPV